ncbi:MAG: hypothetical protein K1X50_06545 [Candidatus Promineofilum sp.]|nr:hypothetical protein [Promineifilum sp.]MCW5861513.1 hypothetical protein [Anaerolineae bacterium]
MITVEVTNANGRTCEVHISWGMTHSRGLTDSRGRISFDVSPGTGTILVDGREVHKGYLSGTIRVQK